MLLKSDAKSKVFSINRSRILCSVLPQSFQGHRCYRFGEKGLELTPGDVFGCIMKNHVFHGAGLVCETFISMPSDVEFNSEQNSVIVKLNNENFEVVLN
jgi:hypothetical protein